jgi:hypothetical protein
MSNLIEEKLVKEFSEIFPGYRVEKSDDEGFKLLRTNAITTDEGREDIWIATVYEMGELFVLMDLNRQIVNERNEL